MKRAFQLWFFILLDLLVIQGQIDGDDESIESKLYAFRNTMAKFFPLENDIVFVVDESYSVGEENFVKEKTFTELIARMFELSPDKTRTAVVTFHFNAETRFDFVTKGNGDMCNFMSSMQKVNFVGGTTNTKEGLETARNILRNGRSDSNKLIVLLSDGESNEGSPMDIAETLRFEGVVIFCIGVAEASEAELLNIASSDNHVYMIKDFEIIKRVNEELTNDNVNKIFVVQSDGNLCNSYCTRGHDCCDASANCACGSDGSYSCACQPGYEGSGHSGKCTKCRSGTYNSQPGQVECLNCPINSHTIKEGSMSISDCSCNAGFFGNPGASEPCRSYECPKLHAPLWGFTEPDDCGTHLNDECAFWCDNPYCPYNGSEPNCLQELSKKVQSPRVCLATGRWSGREFKCEEARCPSLVNPPNGVYHCDVKNYGIRSQCTLTCNKGYRVIIQRTNRRGKAVMYCQPNGEWRGEDAVCQPVLCKSLKTNLKLKVKPDVCGSSPRPYGSQCQHYCIEGYQFVRLADSQDVDDIPKGVRICGSDSHWIGEGEKMQCKDSVHPNITCPPSRTVSTAPGQKVCNDVNWDLPVVVDNDGIQLMPKLVEPPFFKGKRGIKPPHKFEIGKNKMVYKAQDVSGLESACSFSIIVEDTEIPKVTFCPKDVEVYAPMKVNKAMWETPQFSDNSKVVKIVYQSHKSGDVFSVGPPLEITYKANDLSKNEAVCKFHLKAREYKCRYRSPPLHGSLKCKAIPTAKREQICKITCDDGYDIVGQPQNGYECRVSGGVPSWNPRKKWNDCSAKSIPTATAPTLKIKTSVRDCNDPETQKAIMEKYRQKMCNGKKVCRIKNAVIKCTPQKVAKRQRNKRSIEEIEDDNSDFELIIEFEIEDSDLDSSEDSYNEFLNKTAESLNDDIDVEVVISSNVGLACKHGQILKEDYCINCPPGTYQSEGSCEHCALNTYENEEASSQCKTCPEGTFTVEKGAHDISDCLVPCKRGTYSQTGFEQCLACPIGTYQDNDQQQICKKCPDGSATWIEGADSITQCTTPCKPGRFSSTGFEPCDLCPIGSYQAEFQKTECDTCPGDLWTDKEGTTDGALCRRIDVCDPNPCQNGGKCTEENGNFTCSCITGFTGSTCHVNINDCSPHLCKNGGKCVDGIDDYTCRCAAGFTGTNCEEDINDCDNGGCLNNGVCRDDAETLYCECPTDFSGPRCETEIVVIDCKSNPCKNGGKCRDRLQDFYCCCPPGYSGKFCEQEQSHCFEHSCQNGATCVNEQETYMCMCPAGYTGDKCEINIDDCIGKTCLNQGTCVDGIKQFTCQCKPGFEGLHCEKVLTSDFQVTISAARISNYAIVENKQDLFSLTLSFWILSTGDTQPRGTPVSYSYKSRVNGTVASNALTWYNVGKFIIYVHNQEIRTNIRATSDSLWHHYALTWDSQSGLVVIYLDGDVVLRAYDIGIGVPMWRGFFVLGQEQDTLGGGFSATESFLGSLTQFNVWNYPMSEKEVNQISKSCGYIGNVIGWPNVKGNWNGEDLQIASAELCLSTNITNCGVGKPECHCQANNIDDFKCEKNIGSCAPSPCLNGQKCLEKGETATCKCQPGFQGNVCQYDVDECLENNGDCSHGCKNTKGSFSCACPTGYALGNDDKTCFLTTHCTYHGSIYNDQEQWTENCKTCTCTRGNVTCEVIHCKPPTCFRNQTLMTYPDECCSKCVGRQKSCIVKTSNNYITFDGWSMIQELKQGCQYVLAEDCVGGTVQILVQNPLRHGHRKKITIVTECDVLEITVEGKLLMNGQKVTIPYTGNSFRVDYEYNRSSVVYRQGHQSRRHRIRVTMKQEMSFLWTRSGHVEVRVSDQMKTRTCGLCGNFNGNENDDFVLKNYQTANTHTLAEFLNSWKIDNTENCQYK